jgi:chromosome segregation ATPase
MGLAEHVSSATTVNPIRRVVTMLQAIQKKVAEEGERDAKLHSKFMCYCVTGKETLEKSIADGEARIAELGSAVEEALGQKAQLEQDLKDAKDDRTEAKAAVDKATSIRTKEAAAFAAFKGESDADIDALQKATTAIETGMSGAFIQTDGATALRKLVQSHAMDISEADRQDVTAFLQGQYAPASGQIVGVLKELGDEMLAGLSDATTSENAAIKVFEELTAAKTKEINALTAQIEDKSVRLGEVGVNIAEMTNDNGDTVESVADDKKFLADLDANCETAQAKYDEIAKTRAEEQVALAETVKLLNDDDALELFKKTLPSGAASFAEVQISATTARARALAMIQAAQKPHQTRLDFIALALHGQKMGFDKVIAMIDDMVGTLKQEQVDDDKKKDYCASEFDSSDDKKKSLERSVSDSEAAIADAEEGVATLAAEIKALQTSITALDKAVSEATEQRKSENSDYTELMAQNTAAKELIGVAKNRLNKFYNPKLYAAPPKRELSRQDRIAVNMGGTAPPTPAPQGIAGTGIMALVQISAHTRSKGVAAPPPPPEAVGAYKKSSEASGGVIGMMDLLVKELDKEMTEATQSEKDAQADYEKAMQDSAQKRADDSASLGDKQSAKANTESALQQHKDDKASASQNLKGTLQYIQSLHNECDWLVQYFQVRKEARASEIDALGKAKAVLSGADYALLQTHSGRSLRGRA